MFLRSLYRVLSRPGILRSDEKVVSLSTIKGCPARSASSDSPSSSFGGAVDDDKKLGNSGKLNSEVVKTFISLERLSTDLFQAHHLIAGSKNHPVVYGGQVIGQALVAAAKSVTPAYNLHSLHSYFLKAGNVNTPILYNIDRIRDGQSFCTRRVKATQAGEALYNAEISFHKEEANYIEHQSSMPKVAQPEDLRDGKTVIRDCLDDPNIKLEKRHRAFLEWRLGDFPSTMDMKPVCPESYLSLKASEPRFFTWVKAVGHIGSDERLHQCVAAYISDSTPLMGAALFPHVARGFIPSMLFSLDHTIWFHHHKFRSDDWMLYETESPIARGGRSLTLGRLWSRDGTLILSTAQEGLIRTKV